MLILTDWYVPGYKAGGPITSVYKMVKALGDEVEFSILTNNHDWHDPEPFDQEIDKWLKGEGASVKYLSDPNPGDVTKEVRSHHHDVLYFNGIYSPNFHALPLLRSLWSSNSPRIIVAPRGMLNPNAIALKSTKKRVLLSLYRWLGIERKVTFHSTGPKETTAILQNFSNARIKEVSNLVAAPVSRVEAKREGFLSVGRISPVKNTLDLLKLFDQQNENLSLIGTPDDVDYHQLCKAIAARNEGVKLLGGVGPDRISEHYLRSKFSISMTTGENFGHAIIEALSHGCPVIISDRTPWNDLEEQGAGWVIPLEDENRWQQVLKEASDIDPERYSEMSANAVAYVKRKFDLNQLREQYLELFGATN